MNKSYSITERFVWKLKTLNSTLIGHSVYLDVRQPEMYESLNFEYAPVHGLWPKIRVRVGVRKKMTWLEILVSRYAAHW